MNTCEACDGTGFEYRPSAVHISRTLHHCAKCDGATVAPYRTELTPIGEQYVLPGCEKIVAIGKQLSLF